MPEMIAGARAWIELPAPEPIRGGVESVARVIDVTPEGHQLMGVEGITDACATAEEWTEWCDTSPTGRKIFEDAPEIVVGDPFAIYAGVSCDLQRLDEGRRRAEARLGYGESRAIDLHIDAMLTADTDVLDLGGPFPLAQAIGAAEAFAATYYGGAPTLLIPRLYIQCGCSNGALKANLDGTLATCTGSRVAPLTTPVDLPVLIDTAVMYVTGQVTILRGPVQSFSVPQQVAVSNNGTFAPMRALAERVIVPVFDCLVGKVEVTCS